MIDITIHQLLKNIGLSEKESQMYVTLLRNGTQTTSFLARAAKFNRGTAYVILHSLLQQGLCIETIKSKIQYFTALHPKQLLAYLDHQSQQLKDKREQVDRMLGQLVAITNPLSSVPKIQFFDGAEGARYVLERTLEAKEKLLRAYLSIGDIADFVGASFFNEYTTRRIDLGFTLNTIRTSEKDIEAELHDDSAKRYITSRTENREVRYVPDRAAFPVSMYFFDDTVVILSSAQENFALLIESHDLASMQKRLFDVLWNTLPKVRFNKRKSRSS